MATKRTYQPKTKRHSRVHGFLKRMMSKSGRNVLKEEEVKAGKKLAPKLV